MTFLTSHAHVSAGQGEPALIMIEVHVIPTRGVMTGRAILPKLSIVLIVQLVTGITILRSSLELMIDMARLTSYIYMPAFQFERGEVVVELCRRPASRGMALTAVRAKATLMRVVAVMTGITVLRCHFKIAKAACIDMTLRAGKACMLSGNFER